MAASGPQSGDQALLRLLQGSVTLESRASVAAADAAPVPGTSANWYWSNAWIYVEVTIVTAGTSRDARVAIEGSNDDTNWHQLARIADVTGATTVQRIIRLEIGRA